MSQEQVNALQQALLASQEQVLGLSQQLDQVRADATATADGTATQLRGLREEAQNAASVLRNHVAGLQAARRGGGDRDGKGKNGLINCTTFEPKIFNGKTGDPVAIKPWQMPSRLSER